MIDITRNAVWTKDCQGKQDLDFGIITANTRYYPDYSAICEIVLCPDNYYQLKEVPDDFEPEEPVILCQSPILYSDSESSIKTTVRNWYNAHIIVAIDNALNLIKNEHSDFTK